MIHDFDADMPPLQRVVTNIPALALHPPLEGEGRRNIERSEM
jgi:hypothetical protein